MRNKQLRELAVCGFETVRALADHHPERIQRFFFTQDRARFFGSLCKQLAASRRVYRSVPDEKALEKLSGSVHHQGVVAMIAEPVIPFLDSAAVTAFAEQKKTALLLDHVGNANNLGAIIRSAAFFGIDNVVITNEDEQAQISTSMYRVAQGGMEFVNLWKTQNTQGLLDKLRGRMTLIGADHRSKHDLLSLPAFLTPNFGTLIVLGNEELGLAPQTKAACDYLVRISGTGAIESLNVAQAATLFLHAVSALGG